jgi:hypothetical protein
MMLLAILATFGMRLTDAQALIQQLGYKLNSQARTGEMSSSLCRAGN